MYICTHKHTLGNPEMTRSPKMEERFISLGCFWRHCPRVMPTADFHGNALERSRRLSAQVAAPENWDL